MSNCIFARQGNYMVCSRLGCGVRMQVVNPKLREHQYYAACKSPNAPKVAPLRKCREATSVRGLGTMVENALNMIGYTPERHVAIKKKLGLSPTCGCAGRKEWLNDVGQSIGIGA